jgi:hypothetical protein
MHTTQPFLLHLAQIEKNEQQSPLLSASHVDYAVMYKRAQQVAELCVECNMVLSARVTRVHSHGLHASCPGALRHPAGRQPELHAASRSLLNLVLADAHLDS